MSNRIDTWSYAMESTTGGALSSHFLIQPGYLPKRNHSVLPSSQPSNPLVEFRSLHPPTGRFPDT